MRGAGTGLKFNIRLQTGVVNAVAHLLVRAPTIACMTSNAAQSSSYLDLFHATGSAPGRPSFTTKRASVLTPLSSRLTSSSTRRLVVHSVGVTSAIA